MVFMGTRCFQGNSRSLTEDNSGTTFLPFACPLCVSQLLFVIIITGWRLLLVPYRIKGNWSWKSSYGDGEMEGSTKKWGRTRTQAVGLSGHIVFHGTILLASVGAPGIFQEVSLKEHVWPRRQLLLRGHTHTGGETRTRAVARSVHDQITEMASQIREVC